MSKRIFTLLSSGLGLLLSVCFADLSAQDLAWARRLGGDFAQEGNAIKAGSDGSVFHAGNFAASVKLTSTVTLTAGYEYSSITYVGRWDKDGDLLWAKKLDAPSGEYGYSYITDLALDKDDNVYVAGYAISGINFNPDGSHIVPQTEVYMGFIAKYSKDGAFQWVRPFSGSNILINGIALDEHGNSYAIGEFKSGLYFDLAGTASSLSSAGQEDIFLTKINASGAVVWARKFGAASGDKGLDISVFKNEVTIVGSFQGTVNFDPAGTAPAIVATATGTDGFVAQYDTDGAYKYAFPINSTAATNCKSLGRDTAGHIYVTGAFRGTADFDPGTQEFKYTGDGGTTPNFYIARYTNAGAFVWAKHISGTNEVYPNHMAVSATGSLYITGAFRLNPDFDPDPNQTAIYVAQGLNTFAARYDNEGRLNWVNTIGANGTNTGLSVDVDASGNCYTTGYFSGEVDLDPGPAELLFTAPGGVSDGFIQKFTTCEVSGTVNYEACDSFTIDNITYTQSGLYTRYYTSALGCDSISYLDLKITRSVENAVLQDNYCDSAVINGVTYTESGVYMQTYSSAEGCDSNMFFDLTINSVKAEVVQAGAVLTADVTAAGSITADAYQWFNCVTGAPVDGATDQVFIAKENGEFGVAVLVNGCTDTSACVTVDHLPSKVYALSGEEMHIECYPNPARNYVNVQSNFALDGSVVRVISTIGQTVKEVRGLEGKSFRLQLDGFAPGIYQIELTRDGRVIRERIVVGSR